MKTCKRLFSLLALIFLMASCIAPKNIIYLQEKKQRWNDVNPYTQAEVITEQYKIQTNDYIYIRVITENQELAAYYNISGGSGNNSNMQMGGQSSMKYMSYLVDDMGEIDFPSLGKLYVRGLTRSQVKQKLTEILDKQIESYTLMVELANTYFTILGEANAGLYQMPKDQLTIYEALAIAGDLDTYSKRKELQIIRRGVDGVSRIQVVDMTDLNLLDSQESYIYPNDMIYIKPIKAKVFGFGETFSLSLITSLIAFYLLIASFY
ncbi:MAG: polysaccharide biosynthesis/export family protein [Bacteroidales bacterium]